MASGEAPISAFHTVDNSLHGILGIEDSTECDTQLPDGGETQSPEGMVDNLDECSDYTATQHGTLTDTCEHSLSQSLIADLATPGASTTKKRRVNKAGTIRQTKAKPNVPLTPSSTAGKPGTSGKGRGKGRKRPLSEEGDTSTTQSIPEPQDTYSCMVTAINRLSDQIGDLSKRTKRLESSIDSKIKKQVERAMNPVIEKIKKDFNDEIQKVRNEMQHMKDTALHKPDYPNLTESMNTSQINSGVNNIVIRNFPESANENVKDRVNSLLNDLLKVNISIESAELKETKSGTENGVIIAVCKSRDDKDSIMKSKSKLR
ncbi:hypothetical protein DPMN_153142 [Dreissena polymorpha]|uniref:Uncharacterized protein n=1 Tax=Dreissena polymorpha TaxID=45954 RepID=A0A9D4FPC5_DREPO|nr:hypothetical protein DPMN_153142 [Dreissena polymorpha]